MISVTFSQNLSNTLVKYMDSIPIFCEEGRRYFRACATAICNYMDDKENMEAQAFMAPEPYAAILVRGTVMIGFIVHQLGAENEDHGKRLVQIACAINEELAMRHMADMNERALQAPSGKFDMLQIIRQPGIEVEMMERDSGTGLVTTTDVAEEVCLEGADLENFRGLDVSSKTKIIRIVNCQRLASLDGIERATELNTLIIDSCPSLMALQGVESLKSLERFELRGPTKVPDLRLLEGRTSLHLVVDSEQVGASPRLMKMLKARPDQLPNLQVVCQQCGSRNIKGRFVGWYQEREYAKLQFQGEIAEGELSAEVANACKDAGEKADEFDLEDASDNVFSRSRVYANLRVEMACVDCQAPFRLEDAGFDWDKASAATGFIVPYGVNEDPTFEFDSEMLKLPIARAKAKAPDGCGSGNSCPICQSGRLVFEFRAYAYNRFPNDGKCAGEIVLEATSWRSLSHAIQEEYSDVSTTGGDWRWVEPLGFGRGSKVCCEDGCFSAPVQSEDSVVSAILCALAVRLVVKKKGSDRVKEMIASVASGARSPRDVAQAAAGWLLDTELDEYSLESLGFGTAGDRGGQLKKKVVDLLMAASK